MIKAIVVDDEWYTLEEISDFLMKTKDFHVAGKYQNPLKALEEVKAILPQVAFIDIDLPEMDGITLSERLLELHADIMIVFITSYNQYAIQAFDLNAIDYLLKPIKEERFIRMVEKVKQVVSTRKQPSSSFLDIKVFGPLTVSFRDTPVKWQRSKAKEVFAYLLMNHGCYVHKETIIEDLWPDYEPKKALSILQTSIYKIRNLFTQATHVLQLDYNNNGYCLSITEGYCDYFQLLKALSSYRKHDSSTYDTIEQASILFGNGFLAEEGYLWRLEKDQQLRDQLIMSLKEMLIVHQENSCPEKVITTLKNITRLAPFEESMNYRLIKMYLETNNRLEAEQHYQWVEQTLKKFYDAKPSNKIRLLLLNR
ncbi:response regulator [Tindallia californiensis]|uniref:Stage 0 sporulation protein A homolog n=1 Tax=Tindallia californiensis TaxID=159292 RepID=A0A1H3LUE8_9FIRM|nr:response regulator [Tindallia californiensis]SDY67970.1 Two-component response regulator, SAPR family, consists of REC, wHTH and BTAD domains [Tindallia californiensis]